VGRVLGLRLLKLDALIVLTPAEVAPPSSAARAGRPQPPSTSTPTRSVSGRSRLVEAVRTIDAGAEILAEARRNSAAISHDANG
jgi:hypothetical protein